MKRFILFIFVFMFLVLPIVSAFEFDNIKNYDSESREMTVKNSILKVLPLGTVAKIRPISPQENKVFDRGPGVIQLVYEFEIINNVEDYDQPFKEMEFYKLHHNNRPTQRDIIYKYKQFYDVQVNDYNFVCDERESKNGTGTEKYNCRDEIIGSHTEKRFNWVDLNTLKLPKGTLEIGLFTDVKKGETIEFIPTWFGIRMPEYAVWTDALSVDLQFFLNFDEGTGTETLDAVTGTHNATLFQGNHNWIEGKIGNASNFTCASSGSTRTCGYWNLSNPVGIFNISRNFTVNVWHRVNTDTNNKVYFAAGGDDGTAVTRPMFNFRHADAGGGNNRYSMWITDSGSGDQFVNNNENVGIKGWRMVTFLRNGTGASDLYIYLNGSNVAVTNVFDDLADTGDISTSFAIGSAQGYYGLEQAFDLLSVWDRALTTQEIEDLFNNGDGLTYVAPALVDVQVDLNEPQDNNFTGNNNVLFNCSAFTENDGIINLTLYIDNEANFSIQNASAGINLSIETTQSLSDGAHEWTCNAEDVNGLGWPPANRTITIDATIPQVSVFSPTGTKNLFLSPQTENINWSANDTNLNSCWYDYNSSNVTVACHINTTPLTVQNGVYSLIFYANDSSNNVNSSSTRWNYKSALNSETFTAVTTGGSTETFLANLTINSSFSVSEATLNYNNTKYVGEIFLSGPNTILRVQNLATPSVGSITNVTFVWYVELNDASNFNLSKHNQTLLNLGVGLCDPTFTVEIYNLTILDEENQTFFSVNQTPEIEVSINVDNNDRSLQLFNVSINHDGNDTTLICLNRNLTNGTEIIFDTRIKYGGTDHETEYYNIIGQVLNGSTTSTYIPLFPLATSRSTQFQLTFKDSNFLTVENALIFVKRQYVDENVFKVVELPLTDSNGQTVVHLVRNEIVYNIEVVKDNNVLGSFNNIIAFCQDFTIGDCVLDLNAFQSGTEIYNYDSENGIIFNQPTYNETTKQVAFNFVTSDGSNKNVSMFVERNDIFGNVTLCNSAVFSSGGTLSCNAEVTTEDTLLIVRVFVNGVETVVKSFSLSADFGSGGNWIFFIFLVSLIFMFSSSKNMTLIGILIGFVTGIFLGIIKGSIIGVGATGLWLFIAVILIIFKLNKRKPD